MPFSICSRRLAELVQAVGPETVVVAVDAAAGGDAAVPVGAGEPRVHVHLVDGLAVQVLHVLTEGVIAPRCLLDR